jgi:hypothetical protein
VVGPYRNDQLVREDGNHRVESLRRAGRRVAWAIVNLVDAETCDRFEAPAVTT